MDRKKHITCVALLLLTLSPFAATAADAPKPENKLAEEHVRRLQGNYEAQDRLLQEARELFYKKEFEPALTKAEMVLAGLDLEVSQVNSEIARNRLVMVRRLARDIRHAQGEDILMKARQLAADGKYNDAGNLAAQAVALATDAADVVGLGGQPDTKLQRDANSLLRECRNMAKNQELRRDVSLERAQSAKYKEDQKQIAKLLREADGLMRAKRYDAALTKVEQVFTFDPLNADAIQLAANLYQLFYRYGRERSRTDASTILSYTQWQWAEPVFMLSGSSGNVSDGTVKSGSNERIYNKLSNIIYPRVNFTDTEVRTALDRLARDSKKYDPDKEGVEINFIAAEGEEERTVTLNVTNMPLSEVIRYICLLTGFESFVENNCITISREAGSKMISKRIQVTGKVFSDVRGDTGSAPAAAPPTDDGAAPADAGGGDAPAPSGGAASTNPTPEQWRDFFAKHLIKLPEGSQLSSDERSLTLSISTTGACMSEIEELLRRLNTVEHKMVLIEIRALEIGENDCQELGFNWNLGMLGYNMDSNGNLGSKGATGWAFQQGSNTTNGSNDSSALSMIRGVAEATGITNSQVLNNFNVFPALFGSRNWFGSDTPIDLRLTINALAQNQRAETLSAPKLLTVDGQAAEINIGKTYYFPESWDTLEVSIESTGNDTASRSYYRWSYPSPDINKEGTTLGVYLWVRPTVQPDNETIRLELKPRISAYLGQDHGDGRYDVKVYTVNVETKERRVRTFPIWRAKTSRRSLELTVDVHDGEPVVVGGIIDNSTVNRTDKIPILGDLPLIGRFFQSQAENSNKQNLIMFVTARQIDFSGVPVKRRSHTTAIPDLNH